MNPHDIRNELKKAGYTAAKVAAELGITAPGVRQVIDGVGRSSRVEQLISEITDIPLYYLWPQWHDPPEGSPKGFDPTKLNADLLETVERCLASELMRRIPGLAMPFVVRARHRVAVYNACVERGTIAIETGAGTAHEVASFLAHWAENFEQTTGDKPTPEALRKWALAEASPGDPPRGPTQVIASGGSIASGRDTNFGNVTKPRQR